MATSSAQRGRRAPRCSGPRRHSRQRGAPRDHCPLPRRWAVLRDRRSARRSRPRVDRARWATSPLLLGLEGVSSVDSRGTAKLTEIHQLMEVHGVMLRLARVKPQVLTGLHADGIVDLIGEDRVHGNVYRTIQAQLVEDGGRPVMSHPHEHEPGAGSAALRTASVREALDRVCYVGCVARERCDLAGRGVRWKRFRRAHERIDRRLDGAGLVRKIAFSRIDQRRGIALDLFELRLQATNPATRIQARQPLDRVLKAGPSRAVPGFAATAAGERN